jgi:hypothetical protein
MNNSDNSGSLVELEIETLIMWSLILGLVLLNVLIGLI